MLDSGNLAYLAGSVLGAFAIPVVGLGLLLFGLRQRRNHRSTGTAWAAIGAVVCGLGLLLALSSWTARLGDSDRMPRATPLRVGECILDSDFQPANRAATGVDCSAKRARYELAYEGLPDDTCPDGKGKDTSYSRMIANSGIRCFVPNLFEGSATGRKAA